MKERRWPWVVSGILFVGAGLAAGWVTYVSWLPCGGYLLGGHLLAAHGFGLPDYPPACLEQMDAGGYLFDPDSRTTSVAAVAAVLTGAAWLILVVGLRLSLLARLLTVGLGAATMAVGLPPLAPTAFDRAGVGEFPIVVIDAAAIVALGVVIAIWKNDRLAVGRAVIAWAAACSFGVASMVFDYLTTATISPANWDTPPGTGYLTAWFLICSGVVIIVLTQLRHHGVWRRADRRLRRRRTLSLVSRGA